MNEFTLKYNKSSVKWEESLPLGNGKIGACVFGRCDTEIIRLNEETLWEGFPYDWNNPELKEHLPEIRELIFTHRYSDAVKLALRYFKCKGTGSQMCHPGEPFGTFRNAGDIVIYDKAPNKLIERRLDILHGVAYTDTGNYSATHFVSQNANMIADSFIAKHGKLTFDIRYDHNGGGSDNDAGATSYRAEVFTGNDIVKELPDDFGGVAHEDGFAVYDEQLMGDGALKWSFALTVETDGEKAELPDGYAVKNATYINIYSCAHTSFNTVDPHAEVITTLNAHKTFPEMLDESMKRFESFMMRSELSLESDERLRDMYTDERIKNIQAGNEDTGFAELYFNYGKYLLVSSSAPDSTLPANLQGIWSKDNTPPWSADYHININLQMNYWAAEVTGLADCAKPFFEYLRLLKKYGTDVAKNTFGYDGWVSFHATTPHGYTAPGRNPSWGSFSTGGAWCCTHIFEHYRYTLDAEFLKSYWDVIKDCAKFFFDYLVEDPNTGYLVTCPANSPENSFIDPETGEKIGLYAGPTMDNEILRDLFEGILEFSAVVGENDAEFLKKTGTTLQKLMPIKIGRNGTVMEWQEDYAEAEPGHRHISHLYALFPSNQITEDTPELFEAAKKTIKRRLDNGGGHTGWSKAWIINFYARLCDPENAYMHLIDLFGKGTLPNMFDKHPPFQIDGNFGGCAGIANMLFSDVNGIKLLPALPKQWKNGYFKNFRAKGNKLVSCVWRDGRMTESEIKNIKY